MNATALKNIRDLLAEQKSLILNKNAEFRSEQQSSRDATSDEAELVSNELAANVSIHLHERDRTQLLMIEKALGKISEGTYGLCESCGDQIHEKRLQARPFAALCIDCMEDKEDPRVYLN